MSSATDPTRRARELQAQIEHAPTIPIEEFRSKSRRSFLTGEPKLSSMKEPGLSWPVAMCVFRESPFLMATSR